MAAPLLLSTIISALVVVASSTRGTMANGVFQVRRKFHIVDGVYKGSDIGALQTHDGNRHRRRNLMAAELPLGGFSIPYGTGLYYTDIGIGTPAVKYYVQVDTGSEAFWVNGISCKQCPHESDILRKLTFYDPRSSVSSKEVKCDDTICTSRPPCNMTLRCPYIAVYSDGGLTMGILFTDLLHYHQLYGNGQTQPTSTSVTFGEVYYLVNLKSIDVAGTTLQLPANIFETTKTKGTFIDSGTTLVYLPEIVYSELILAVFAKHPDITLGAMYNFECFHFLGSVDDKFPKITFNFENDLTLDVYPYDYLLEYEGNQYCFGFQDAGKQGHKDKILLGDMVISNKVVVYDMEKQAIGWTEHNCSSSIKIKDEKTGATYTVQADNISSGWTIQWQMPLVLLLVTKVSNYLLSKLCMVYNINSVLTQLLGL
ncbi:aspartic proteinase 39-like isoform X3 [Oryza glaberrima]|uniref:aspartic proteinase 39-like isoform X3 n=1 Tax=Oryza glaberrima TaxID=4538 RepID=UPI00224C1BAC|nr:aspartic proteinase 39-like isoform X3 [Oryza glaberrima]